MKTTKLKKKKAKRVPKPYPISDLIVPAEFPPQPEEEGRCMTRKMAIESAGKVELPQPEEGRFMRRKRAVEGTAEESGFQDVERAHKDADYVNEVILTYDLPSKRRASDQHELKTGKLKKKKAKGVMKDVLDPRCNSELVNCKNQHFESISSIACNLSEVLCAVTGSPSQKVVISKILVSFLQQILKLNRSEASISKDNAMSQASHCLMKHVNVLVQLLQTNLKDENEKLKDENENLKYENEKLKDEREKLKDMTKNLQKGIEAILSVIHLK